MNSVYAVYLSRNFKIALKPILKHIRDGLLHQRLMRLFSKIKSLDRRSDKGRCTVGDGLKTLKGKLLLREFVFTPKAGIRQQFGNPAIAEKHFNLVWKGFDPSSARFPKGATHFGLLYLILAYDLDRRLFRTYEIAAIKRGKQDKSEKLELRPDNEITKKEGMQYIAVVGLRFLEILGDEEYELLGKDAVGIEVLEVF